MRNSFEYIEVTFRLTPFSEENAEILEAALSDLPYESFMFGADADGNGTLKAYIPKADYSPHNLKAAVSGLTFAVTYSACMIQGEDWNQAWEDSLRPFEVGDRVRIVTVNGNSDSGDSKDDIRGKGRYEIRIRPNMAFGTGQHETTRMMIENMLAYEDEIKDGIVMDIGCGTGILAILAAEMGAVHSYGIDIDAVAAQSAADNVRLNGMEDRVRVMYGDASLLQRESYDFLLANIHRNTLMQDMETYSQSLRRPGKRYSTGISDGGVLVCSGFYESDSADIVAAAEASGLKKEHERKDGEWACLSFRHGDF